MFFKTSKLATLVLFIILCIIQTELSASYKTEIEITPAPPEEPTTKKSWLKKWFGSSSQSTVDPILEVSTIKSAAQLPPHVPASSRSNDKPPPLVISNAPLVPLGPRPDTPSSSPFGAGAPQWPQANTNVAATTTSTSTSPPIPFGGRQANAPPHLVSGVLLTTSTTTLKPSVQQNSNNVQKNSPTPDGQHNLPSFQSNHNNLPRPGGQPNQTPGFTPYQSPKSQPSGVDLSYGNGFANGGHPQQAGRPSSGLSPITSATGGLSSISTSTTTGRPPQLDFDLRSGFDSKIPGTPLSDKDGFPALPSPKISSVKDFPGLPLPKSSVPPNPTSTSAWNKPLPTSAQVPSSFGSSSTTVLPSSSKSPATGTNAGTERVSFIPHTSSSTTVRPGFEKQGNTLATDDEIRSLTESLYNKEVNSQINLVSVHPQGKTRSIDSTDEASQPLLEVDPKVFESPTVAAMRLLFNNYEEDTLVNEHISPIEHKEENDFVDAVMATNVMRQAMLFLQTKGIVTPDPKTHRELVKELWFTQYSRGNGKIGSSGFEHVFVNEVKNGTIIGLHNWVYFHDEEKAGHLDYKGYINQLDLGTKGKVLKVRFTHNGLNKPVNTLFIGTSPELELALYTVCFKVRPDRTCPVSLGNSKFGIVTYSWRYRGKSLIGSAYPEI